MIFGVGIDSVKVDRIAEKMERPEFMEKVFSKNEIDYCSKNTHPAEHYAARFAAKEAFLKAIGSGLGISYDLKQIEVVHNDNGAPELILHGEFENLRSNWNKVYLSLTHTDSVACAIIILEQ